MSAPLPPFQEMTNEEFAAAVRSIVGDSSGADEICARLASELGYPYELDIKVIPVADSTAIQAMMLGVSLGGVVLKTGEMIWMTIRSRDGDVLDI